MTILVYLSVHALWLAGLHVRGLTPSILFNECQSTLVAFRASPEQSNANLVC